MLFSVWAKYLVPSAALRGCQGGAPGRLLSWSSFLLRNTSSVSGPCLYVAGLHLQIRQVAGAALQGPYRDIQRAEQVYRVLPQFVIPEHCCLPVCRLRSSPASQTDGSGIRLSPRCRERLSPYGSRENSWSGSEEADPHSAWSR